jgi:hypothetical protein
VIFPSNSFQDFISKPCVRVQIKDVYKYMDGAPIR